MKSPISKLFAFSCCFIYYFSAPHAPTLSLPQVTEREHERMLSELTAKHDEELSRLRTEVSLELRESLEAAHQAELQQAQVNYIYAHRQKNITYFFPFSFFPPLHKHVIVEGF